MSRLPIFRRDNVGMNVAYQIIRSDRKTIAIQIKPDGQVIVHRNIRIEQSIAPFGGGKVVDFRYPSVKPFWVKLSPPGSAGGFDQSL